MQMRGILDDIGNFISNTGEAIKTSAPTALAVYRQQQLDKLNIERVKKGLEPLSASESFAPIEIKVQGASEAGQEAANILKTVKLGVWVAIGLAGIITIYYINRRK